MRTGIECNSVKRDKHTETIHICLSTDTIASLEESMAERKSALKRAPERPELDALLDRAREVIMTDEQLLEQRASFVYGNAPKGSRITKETALKATKTIRVMQKAV